MRLLRATQAELARHAPQREACSRWVDPGGLARSLPGFAEVGAPALVATMGHPGRFARGAKFRSFTGLAPARRRPARPTASPSRSTRPATGCCAPPWSAPATPPASWTRSWPASTGSRWSSAATTTSARCAWSPPTWPSGPGRSSTAGCPMSSATPTAPPLPPPRPRPSSPSAGPSQRRSASGGAAGREGPQQVHPGHGKGAQGATRRPSPSPSSLGRRTRRVKPAQPRP